LFGTTGTVLVNAPAGADAQSVGPLRLALGGVTLLAVATVRRTPWGAWRRWSTLLGAAGVALFQLGYFLSVERTGVAMGTVTTIGSGPVLGGLIASARHRHLPSPAWLVGTAVSVAGVALLGLAGVRAEADPSGIALAVAAGLGWATFTTVGKHQIDTGVESTASMAAMFTAGALLLSPLLAWHHPSWVVHGNGWWIVPYLGVITVGVAYSLYGYALRHLHAPTVITLTLLEPITAAALGAVVVHEGISAAGWMGIALVLAGLWVTARAAAEPAGTETVLA
jgi:DME family drug/metabolite transporter